jgi:hypothetical protein
VTEFGEADVENKTELADMLERLLGDAPDCGDWEWDDFVSVKAEPELEPFRQRLRNAQTKADFDVVAIRQIIGELRR